ncbi:SH3-like domain-containing protein [Virgibacillus sp. SK37]|uniref:SH3-like domain-containing protein n=1 Tax=Virgibacillus sp. SK37 TaxID=403957 RepID=UPI0035102187
MVSLLGHIKGGESLIASTPSAINDGLSSTPYKNSVYYIKKQIDIKGETYYLLSERPSSEIGTIGWMKKTDLSLHQHLLIDEDKKSFQLKGEGSAYSKPWGGKNDLAYGDLSQFEDEIIVVDRTEKVGQNIWYRGEIKNKEVWLHSSSLTSVIEQI